MRAPDFMSGSLLFLGVVACVATQPGCGRPSQGSRARGASTQEVVYGVDDRMEPYASPDERWRRIGQDSVAAMVDRRALDTTDPENVRLSGDTLADLGLCPDQRFLDQPTVADCSATLIDDDLLLTAGHCVTSLRECQRYRFVFGYHWTDGGTLSRITTEDIFTCQSLVVHRLSEGQESLDYAILQLDRPATPRRVPAPIRASVTPVAQGGSVTLIGFPSGLPAKVDSGGRVLDPRAETLDYFAATTDSFYGNSGSGAFDADGALVGILVRGEEDYEEVGGCLVVRVLPEDGSGGFEEASYAVRALAELCEVGWPSQRLCGSTTQVCGDGVCAVPESWQSCPEDCPKPVCGNGRCEPGELASCEADCGPAPNVAPSTWVCPRTNYGTRDGCHCACGAVDPDCADPTQEVRNCRRGQSCSPDGLCIDGGGHEDGGIALPDAGAPAEDGGGPADGGMDGGPAPDAGSLSDAGSDPSARVGGSGCSAVSGSGGWVSALFAGLLGWRRLRRARREHRAS
jgi:V8-like Glu-specific endopeptidase